MAEKFTIDEISPIVYETVQESPHGVACKFVALDERWAIKLYTSSRMRNGCFHRQRKANKLGLGPEVGQKINLPETAFPEEVDLFQEDFSIFLYGYVTEVIETVQHEFDMGLACPAWSWAYKHEKELDPIRKRLLNEMNWDFYDWHGKNWGRKNGQLMPIDFGID